MKILSKILNVTLLTSILSLQIIAQKSDEKSAMLLKALTETNGGFEKLSQKNDVQFTYTYDNFEKGKDVSLEKHIFAGEHSWGAYSTHELHVLPGKEGKVIQAFVDGKPMISLKGEKLTDPKLLGNTTFLRKVNFFWFTMMYKVNDPGTIHEYLGTEDVDGVVYDKVRLTYQSDVVKKEKNDEYILYFNPDTHLVDQFFYNVVDKGLDKPIAKMKLNYEQIEGVYIATVRQSFKPNKDGKYSLSGKYTTSDIKFNNGFKSEDFKL